MNLLKMACSIPQFKKLISKIFSAQKPSPVNAFGIGFKNPVGLGAGFDKNAKYLRELEALGFGFIEIGTVTPRPQTGNDKPRLFRLPKDKALINRMGFNNEGVEVVAARLKKWRKKVGNRNVEFGIRDSTPNSPGRRSTSEGGKPQTPNLIIGGNIGKNKSTPNEDAWKDYEICFRTLHPFVDFFVVNVSSPNTPGLRELQEKESLKKILTHLQNRNADFENKKPILLKIAPDLSWSQIDDVIDLAKEIQLDGLVATNTTVSRDQLQTSNLKLQTKGAGGLSGKPLTNRSTEIVQYIHQKTSGQIPVIASGGIFTAVDASEKFNAGAELIEVWTGFIYEGPKIVKNILTNLK